jgi:2,4-dienoyl-CoA reductase-like NADH-dependent reductase (Old Yellow Enzyme family)
MTLFREIEQFCRKNNMTVSRFGREAMHDPRFVFELRNGTEPRPKTIAKVQEFMRGFTG